MAFQTFGGNPGETWRNDTGRVLYQLIVQWHNSCGTCCQYDHMIGPSWPIPLHFGCNCVQRVVLPGQTGLPFTDFRAEIRKLDPVQKSRVVGASNLKLIEKGVVEWDDVVMTGRVRDLREVASAKGLTVAQMVKAGVKPSIAEEAYRSVHTAAHEIADQQRQEALGRLKALGVSRDEVRRMVADRLAGRVTVQRPPSGGSPPPPTPPPAPSPPPVIPAAPTPLTPAQVEKTLGVKLKPIPPAPVVVEASSRFDLANAGETRKAVETSLSMIESLHGLPESARRIPIQGEAMDGAHGLFRHWFGVPLSITVNPESGHQSFAAVHEIGHYVEFSIPGRTDLGKRDWAKDPVLKDWHETVHKSEVVKYLAAVRDESRRDGDDAFARYVEYLLLPEELWARSYTQWVAERAGDEGVRAKVAKEAESTREHFITHWPEGDFRPVSAAVQQVFETLGWLKRTNP